MNGIWVSFCEIPFVELMIETLRGVAIMYLMTQIIELIDAPIFNIIVLFLSVYFPMKYADITEITEISVVANPKNM